MPKISEKTKIELSKIIDKKIMDARVQIMKVISDKSESDCVDNILYELNISCPQDVIDYFKN